jgi:hypothetical protein
VVSTGMAAIVATLASDTRKGLDAVDPLRCAQILGMTGVAASVLASDGSTEVVWRTDGASTSLEDLQFTVGEGPGIDAAASGELVLESDLAAVLAQRWSVFRPAALKLGVRAVFAVPLQIGAIRVGVLVAQRQAPGPVSHVALADLLILAHAATDVLLGASAGTGAPRWLAGHPAEYRAEVHQATGMVSAQLGVPLAEALIRMRAYAFSEHRDLTEVAADVVARRLRLGPAAR